MKKLISLCGLLCALLFSVAQEASAETTLPPKEKFYLVLLAGQSNMAGRGIMTAEDKTPYERVLVLDKSGKWVPAHAPLHYDMPTAGVGPGDTFAKLLAKSDPTITVGIIPTACGGSSLEVWKPGAYWKQTKSHPYDDAVARTQKALEVGTLKAILWHQGESDCTPQNAKTYEKDLDTLIKDFRKKFHAENVPVIIGQLSKFPGEKWSKEKSAVDKAQQDVVRKNRPAAFVKSDGLKSNPDKLHFDRDSQIKFGERYFKEYQKLAK